MLFNFAKLGDKGSNMEGKLIAVEGIDCSGKTTVVGLLNQELFRNSYCPIILEEFGTIVGQFFFDSVVAEDLGVSIPAQVLLRAAGQISELIKHDNEVSNSKTILLADRYVDSNVIYQSVEYSLRQKSKTADIRSFQEWARGVYGMFYIKPVTTFVLDLSADAAIERAKVNNEPIKPLKFLELARQEYLQLATKDSNNYKIVDATQSPEKVLSQIMEYLITIL